MSKFSRIKIAAKGVGMIALSFLMMLEPEDGYTLMLLVMAGMVFFKSACLFLFYISSAIHMVGGKTILYRGVMMLDFSLFFFTLTTVPIAYVVVGLMAILLFMALVAFLRARESRKLGAGAWKLYLMEGIVSILIAGGCGVYHASIRLVVFVFCAGLILSGILKMITAFRQTDIIYIQ